MLASLREASPVKDEKDAIRENHKALPVTLSTFVSLSVNSAKGLSRWAERCFAALSMTRLSLLLFPPIVTPATSPDCHPEHIRSAQCKLSEGSLAMGNEMLRCAQHDRAVTHSDAWINLFMCIIGLLQRFFTLKDKYSTIYVEGFAVARSYL